jgi:CheY-like chemotaxis protein
MAARILIIEDNPVSLQLTKRLLEEGGYAVLTAADPARGLALTRQQRPDFVICDLQLPAMNGFEVLKELQQDPGCCRIPVLALTAFGAPGDDARALAAGFCSYLRKPIDPREFVRRIEDCLPAGLRASHPAIPAPPGHRLGAQPHRRR